jgi:putative tryptophan/tyrosine transport system substrate-binding protein
MRRREFISLVGGAIAWPFSASAQQPEQMRRVGVLMARDENDPEGQKQAAALRTGLRDIGWKIGQSLQLDFRWVVGDSAKSSAAARELVALKPDLLVANATPSLVAMRPVANTIPIVFVSVADPVGQGFVPSLSRPGGTITGFTAEEATMGGKWLGYLKEIAPRTASVTAMFNPDTAPYAPMFLPVMEAAAPALKVSLSTSRVHSTAEIEQALASAAQKPDAALIVIADSFLFNRRAALISLAAQYRIPAIYPIVAGATEGGLIAYGIDRVDLFRRTVDYVDRILKGGAPAELPVQQPTKFELAINLKTAKTLGLAVPQSLVATADDVIE